MKIIIKTSNKMEKLGETLALFCEYGLIIYLYGEIGSGKTTLVRGFLRGLGYKGHVKSPTFTLLESYQISDNLIYHFDLYRLRDDQELVDIGARECFTSDSVCLLEWPERIKHVFPAADLICKIKFFEAFSSIFREVNLIAGSNKGKNIIDKLVKNRSRCVNLE